MGLRGPQKRHPKLVLLDGNPGRRPVTDSGIEANGTPFIPEHLCDDARGCMGVVMASMPPRFFTAADTFVLAAFAEAWVLHKRAAHEIASPDFKWIVKSARGAGRPNPWLRIANQQAALMAMLGDRLRLNPKARAGLHVPQEKPRSKFDGLLGGGFDA